MDADSLVLIFYLLFVSWVAPDGHRGIHQFVWAQPSTKQDCDMLAEIYQTHSDEHPDPDYQTVRFWCETIARI